MNKTRVLTLSMCEANNGKQQNPAGPTLQVEQTAGHVCLRVWERVRVARKSVTLFPSARALRCGASRALSMSEKPIWLVGQLYTDCTLPRLLVSIPGSVWKLLERSSFCRLYTNRRAGCLQCKSAFSQVVSRVRFHSSQRARDWGRDGGAEPASRVYNWRKPKAIPFALAHVFHPTVRRASRAQLSHE